MPNSPDQSILDVESRFANGDLDLGSAFQDLIDIAGAPSASLDLQLQAGAGFAYLVVNNPYAHSGNGDGDGGYSGGPYRAASQLLDVLNDAFASGGAAPAYAYGLLAGIIAAPTPAGFIADPNSDPTPRNDAADLISQLVGQDNTAATTALNAILTATTLSDDLHRTAEAGVVASLMSGVPLTVANVTDAAYSFALGGNTPIADAVAFVAEAVALHAGYPDADPGQEGAAFAAGIHGLIQGGSLDAGDAFAAANTSGSLKVLLPLVGLEPSLVSSLAEIVGGNEFLHYWDPLSAQATVAAITSAQAAGQIGFSGAIALLTGVLAGADGGTLASSAASPLEAVGSAIRAYVTAGTIADAATAVADVASGADALGVSADRKLTLFVELGSSGGTAATSAPLRDASAAAAAGLLAGNITAASLASDLAQAIPIAALSVVADVVVEAALASGSAAVEAKVGAALAALATSATPPTGLSGGQLSLDAVYAAIDDRAALGSGEARGALDIMAGIAGASSATALSVGANLAPILSHLAPGTDGLAVLTSGLPADTAIAVLVGGAGYSGAGNAAAIAAFLATDTTARLDALHALVEPDGSGEFLTPSTAAKILAHVAAAATPAVAAAIHAEIVAIAEDAPTLLFPASSLASSLVAALATPATGLSGAVASAVHALVDSGDLSASDAVASVGSALLAGTITVPQTVELLARLESTGIDANAVAAEYSSLIAAGSLTAAAATTDLNALSPGADAALGAAIGNELGELGALDLASNAGIGTAAQVHAQAVSLAAQFTTDATAAQATLDGLAARLGGSLTAPGAAALLVDLTGQGGAGASAALTEIQTLSLGQVGQVTPIIPVATVAGQITAALGSGYLTETAALHLLQAVQAASNGAADGSFTVALAYGKVTAADLDAEVAAGRFGVAQAIAILDAAIGQSSGATQAALLNEVANLAVEHPSFVGTALPVLTSWVGYNLPAAHAALVTLAEAPGLATTVYDALFAISQLPTSGNASNAYKVADAHAILSDLYADGLLTTSQASAVGFAPDAVIQTIANGVHGGIGTNGWAAAAQILAHAADISPAPTASDVATIVNGAWLLTAQERGALLAEIGAQAGDPAGYGAAIASNLLPLTELGAVIGTDGAHVSPSAAVQILVGYSGTAGIGLTASALESLFTGGSLAPHDVTDAIASGAVDATGGLRLLAAASLGAGAGSVQAAISLALADGLTGGVAGTTPTLVAGDVMSAFEYGQTGSSLAQAEAVESLLIARLGAVATHGLTGATQDAATAALSTAVDAELQHLASPGNGLTLADLVTVLARSAGSASGAVQTAVLGQIAALTSNSDPGWLVDRVVDAASGVGAITAAQDAAVLVAVAGTGSETLQYLAGQAIATMIAGGSLTTAQATTAVGAAGPDLATKLAFGMIEGDQPAAAGAILAGLLPGLPAVTIADGLAAAAASTPSLTAHVLAAEVALVDAAAQPGLLAALTDALIAHGVYVDHFAVATALSGSGRADLAVPVIATAVADAELTGSQAATSLLGFAGSASTDQQVAIAAEIRSLNADGSIGGDPATGTFDLSDMLGWSVGNGKLTGGQAVLLAALAIDPNIAHGASLGDIVYDLTVNQGLSPTTAVASLQAAEQASPSVFTNGALGVALSGLAQDGLQYGHSATVSASLPALETLLEAGSLPATFLNVGMTRELLVVVMDDVTRQVANGGAAPLQALRDTLYAFAQASDPGQLMAGVDSAVRGGVVSGPHALAILETIEVNASLAFKQAMLAEVQALSADGYLTANEATAGTGFATSLPYLAAAVNPTNPGAQGATLETALVDDLVTGGVNPATGVAELRADLDTGDGITAAQYVYALSLFGQTGATGATAAAAAGLATAVADGKTSAANVFAQLVRTLGADTASVQNRDGAEIVAFGDALGLDHGALADAVISAGGGISALAAQVGSGQPALSDAAIGAELLPFAPANTLIWSNLQSIVSTLESLSYLTDTDRLAMLIGYAQAGTGAQQVAAGWSAAGLLASSNDAGGALLAAFTNLGVGADTKLLFLAGFDSAGTAAARSVVSSIASAALGSPAQVLDGVTGALPYAQALQFLADYRVPSGYPEADYLSFVTGLVAFEGSSHISELAGGLMRDLVTRGLVSPTDLVASFSDADKPTVILYAVPLSAQFNDDWRVATLAPLVAQGSLEASYVYNAIDNARHVGALAPLDAIEIITRLFAGDATYRGYAETEPLRAVADGLSTDYAFNQATAAAGRAGLSEAPLLAFLQGVFAQAIAGVGGSAMTPAAAIAAVQNLVAIGSLSHANGNELLVSFADVSPAFAGAAVTALLAPPFDSSHPEPVTTALASAFSDGLITATEAVEFAARLVAGADAHSATDPYADTIMSPLGDFVRSLISAGRINLGSAFLYIEVSVPLVSALRLISLLDDGSPATHAAVVAEIEGKIAAAGSALLWSDTVGALLAIPNLLVTLSLQDASLGHVASLVTPGYLVPNHGAPLTPADFVTVLGTLLSQGANAETIQKAALVALGVGPASFGSADEPAAATFLVAQLAAYSGEGTGAGFSFVADALAVIQLGLVTPQQVADLLPLVVLTTGASSAALGASADTLVALVGSGGISAHDALLPLQGSVYVYYDSQFQAHASQQVNADPHVDATIIGFLVRIYENASAVETLRTEIASVIDGFVAMHLVLGSTEYGLSGTAAVATIVGFVDGIALSGTWADELLIRLLNGGNGDVRGAVLSHFVATVAQGNPQGNAEDVYTVTDAINAGRTAGWLSANDAMNLSVGIVAALTADPDNSFEHWASGSLRAFAQEAGLSPVDSVAILLGALPNATAVGKAAIINLFYDTPVDNIPNIHDAAAANHSLVGAAIDALIGIAGQRNGLDPGMVNEALSQVLTLYHDGLVTPAQLATHAQADGQFGLVRDYLLHQAPDDATILAFTSDASTVAHLGYVPTNWSTDSWVAGSTAEVAYDHYLLSRGEITIQGAVSDLAAYTQAHGLSDFAALYNFEAVSGQNAQLDQLRAQQIQDGTAELAFARHMLSPDNQLSVSDVQQRFFGVSGTYSTQFADLTTLLRQEAAGQSLGLGDANDYGEQFALKQFIGLSDTSDVYKAQAKAILSATLLDGSAERGAVAFAGADGAKALVDDVVTLAGSVGGITDTTLEQQIELAWLYTWGRGSSLKALPYNDEVIAGFGSLLSMNVGNDSITLPDGTVPITYLNGTTGVTYVLQQPNYRIITVRQYITEALDDYIASAYIPNHPAAAQAQASGQDTGGRSLDELIYDKLSQGWDNTQGRANVLGVAHDQVATNPTSVQAYADLGAAVGAQLVARQIGNEIGTEIFGSTTPLTAINLGSKLALFGLGQSAVANALGATADAAIEGPFKILSATASLPGDILFNISQQAVSQAKAAGPDVLALGDAFASGSASGILTASATLAVDYYKLTTGFDLNVVGQTAEDAGVFLADLLSGNRGSLAADISHLGSHFADIFLSNVYLGSVASAIVKYGDVIAQAGQDLGLGIWQGLQIVGNGEIKAAISVGHAVESAFHWLGIDGYIAHATVFADSNLNGVLDQGEQVAIEDGNGGYTLTNPIGPIILTGGIDLSTGLAFTGTLTAPSSSGVISPLTTLIQKTATLGQANPISAQAQVAAALGLPSGIDLSHLDPVAATLSGQAGGREAMAAAASLLNTAALIAAAGGTTDAFAAIAAAINSGSSHVDLTDPATVASIAADAGVSAGEVAALTTIATTSNALLAHTLATIADPVDYLKTVMAINKDAQGDASHALHDAGSDPTLLSVAVAEHTGTAFDLAVSANIATVDTASFTPEALVHQPLLPAVLVDYSGNENAFGQVAHDAHGPIGEVFAFYDAFQGRAPDPLGFEDLTHDLQTGMSLHDLAEAMLSSPEHVAKFGHFDQGSDADFLTQLYSTVQHRAPDADGMTHFENLLGQGLSRVDVAVDFALSDEHIGRLQPSYDAGVFAPDTGASDIARLYFGIQGRAPDAEGLHHFVVDLFNGRSLGDVAGDFLASGEYQSKFGGLNNADFVDTLYQNAEGRHVDPDGLSHFVSALENGTSRVDVALDIVESHEAKVHLSAIIESGWHLA